MPAGSNTSSVPRPALGSISYSSTGIFQCTVPGTVALTYDDGPYLYTDELLDVLKANDAKATFFVTGNNYGKRGIDNTSTPYPDVVRRMYNEGHQIGSHTWSHQDLDTITHDERMDQMIKNEMAFRNILGLFPTYMRPPFDSCKEDTGCRDDMSALGYHIIEYNIDTYDYVDYDADDVQLAKNNVTAGLQGSNTSSSYIVYAHDTHETTVNNLTAFMIQTVNEKGLKLVTIGECLGDPKENWYRNATTGTAWTFSGNITGSSLTSTGNVSQTGGKNGSSTLSGGSSSASPKTVTVTAASSATAVATPSVQVQTTNAGVRATSSASIQVMMAMGFVSLAALL